MIEPKLEKDTLVHDYETGKRLLAPFVVIALQGSKREGVRLNVHTLEESMIIDELFHGDSSVFYERIFGGENVYSVFAGDADYNLNGENLLENRFQILGLKGYFSEDNIKNHLPNVYSYFTRIEDVRPAKSSVEEPIPEAEDDIPF